MRARSGGRGARFRGVAAALCALAALAAGCGESGGGGPLPPEPGISPDALSYLTEALDVMQQRSVNRLRIDWPVFRADVVRAAGPAQTFRDTYPAIRYAIKGLGDNHSYFVEPAQAAGAGPPSSPPRADRVRERLGYLRVPGFSGSGDIEFAQQLQDMIRQLDGSAAPPCGWIVDLRANPGGNMWPMLLGVGPLVGSGVVGYFVDPDSTWTSWHYRAGEAGISTAPSGLRVPAPYELRRPDPPVAVLTGPTTASSGEAITTAFRGRPETRSFGAGTAGLSTGVAGFRFRDGAQLGLATSVFADRTRRLYGGVIEPDQPVGGVMKEDPSSGDAGVDAAAAWLMGRPACR